MNMNANNEDCNNGNGENIAKGWTETWITSGKHL